ncbi:MAG: metal-dependent hydrolase [Pirellulales bacterium]|nr:metal-dependent hydrolase [Pirellulales bacterium]
MASPLAHSLAGLAVGSVMQPRLLRHRAAWLAFSVFAANAPDFDILFGLLAGRINFYHHHASHSFVALAGFALVAGLALARPARSFPRAFAAAAALYGSHLLIDVLCGPVHEEGGSPWFWPLSSEQVRSPVTLFAGIRHGGSVASVGEFFDQFFSWHNVEALILELFLMVPWVIVAAWSLARRREAALRNRWPHPTGPVSPEYQLLKLRLLQLERWNYAAQVVGLVAITTLPMVVAGLRNVQTSEINTEQLVLRDPEGRHCASMFVRRDGQPMLVFYDPQGGDRMLLGLNDDFQPMLALMGKDELARFAIKLEKDNRPMLALVNQQRSRSVLAIRTDGAAELSFYNDNGGELIRLPQGVMDR